MQVAMILGELDMQSDIKEQYCLGRESRVDKEKWFGISNRCIMNNEKYLSS